ncbi:PNO1 [Enterospora canceri]|uniref:Pre-rRNA-processing protein PNO1 n=1 Tax=Enterospora canceri TaxID=1081671 RepID=A0A1Y1S618_9MICR|nr:PNO1 [Enterospora canceri]
MIEETPKIRSVEIPRHKVAKIKENWVKIYTAIIEYAKLHIRYNNKSNAVEFKVADHTVEMSYLDRAVVFVESIIGGFRVEDAIAVLKYKDVFMEQFEISEVKRMRSNHLTRAIGRIIGRQGKTKEAIENFSKCKFILIDQKIRLLGCVENIKIAKDAIGRLIQGSEPTSIFNRLRIKSTKLKEKYGCLQTIYDDLREE